MQRYIHSYVLLMEINSYETPDGDKFLRDVLHNDGSYYIIGGCAPFMQEKMFRDALKEKGVEKGKHIALDLRNMKVEDAFNKVAEAVNKIVGGK